STDTVEQLLYDFSLGVNDVYPLTYGHSSFPQLEIIAIDSVLIENVFRGRFILLPPNSGIYDTVKVIEGIGSQSGLLTMYSTFCFEICTWLACFQQDGETLYSDDF